jgi:hypothetical protein
LININVMYSELNKRIGNTDNIEVFRHTYAVRLKNKIEIQYNKHPIMTFYADGDVLVDHGGMMNRGVKDRINKFLPTGYRIAINFGYWYLYVNNKVSPYKNPLIL